MSEPLTPRLTASTLWGVLGFVALLGNAVYRLSPLAIDSLTSSLGPLQWALVVVWCLFMGYSEGYKGFHKQAAPRVVARGLRLHAIGNPLLVVFAPLYCMGLVYASKKRLIISWAIVAMIVALVLGVRLLEQPWRGIVDAGVVLGLALGAASTLYFLVRAATGSPVDVDPDLPTPSS